MWQRLMNQIVLTQGAKKIADLADPAINKQFEIKKKQFLEVT